MPPFEEGTARGFVRRAGGGSISVSAVLATNAALPATLFDGEKGHLTEPYLRQRRPRRERSVSATAVPVRGGARERRGEGRRPRGEGRGAAPPPDNVCDAVANGHLADCDGGRRAPPPKYSGDEQDERVEEGAAEGLGARAAPAATCPGSLRARAAGARGERCAEADTERWP